ncbi:MAG: hypothetical protein AB7G25_13425 [Sphingomonadaceae bacterium]
MLHVLASAYFVLLMVAATGVVVAMLKANWDIIIRVLTNEPRQTTLPQLAKRSPRPSTPARVVRTAASASVLRMAA